MAEEDQQVTNMRQNHCDKDHTRQNIHKPNQKHMETNSPKVPQPIVPVN
jgi:hypothetical protein